MCKKKLPVQFLKHKLYYWTKLMQLWWLHVSLNLDQNQIPLLIVINTFKTQFLPLTLHHHHSHRIHRRCCLLLLVPPLITTPTPNQSIIPFIILTIRTTAPLLGIIWILVGISIVSSYQKDMSFVVSLFFCCFVAIFRFLFLVII